MGFDFIKKLPTPEEIRNQFPIDAELQSIKDARDKELKDVFTGDTLFRLSVGRTDFPGGSFEEIKDSILNKLGNLDRNCNIYPGHNENTKLGFELDNNPFLQ